MRARAHTLTRSRAHTHTHARSHPFKNELGLLTRYPYVILLGHAGAGRSHKPTRVRTVLNEKQLHTLRTCYNANPRPDALMKEQLVEMTGLSPR